MKDVLNKYRDISFVIEIKGDQEHLVQKVMEIIINGPGGTVSTWVLNEAQYNYWKDKSRKFIFDYSWNLPDMREGNHFDEEHPPRDKLGVPDNAWFFQPRDQIWRGDKRPNKLNNVLDI